MQFIQQSPVGGRRGGDVRPHEDGVQTDALDVGPRDGQGLVPAQQPEEPGPPQQKQTPDAGRVGVQLHIVHPAKAGPVLQLDDFLAAQLPKGHLPRPLTVPSYAGAGRTMQKGWKIQAVQVVLGRLVEKGYLSCEKIGRLNYYTPLVAEADYRAAETETFVEKLYRNSPKSLIAALVQSQPLSKEDLEEIRALLDRGEES